MVLFQTMLMAACFCTKVQPRTTLGATSISPYSLAKETLHYLSPVLGTLYQKLWLLKPTSGKCEDQLCVCPKVKCVSFILCYKYFSTKFKTISEWRIKWIISLLIALLLLKTQKTFKLFIRVIKMRLDHKYNLTGPKGALTENFQIILFCVTFYWTIWERHNFCRSNKRLDRCFVCVIYKYLLRMRLRVLTFSIWYSLCARGVINVTIVKYIMWRMSWK